MKTSFLSSSLRGTVLFCAGLLMLLGAPGAQAGRGVALAIGLNEVNPAHYKDGQGNPWKGTLKGCENDAKDMSDIAKKEGFEVMMLLTQAAKRGAVIDALTKLGNELVSGDSLVVSFSGHGGTLPDSNGDEEDAQDETWCLYDGQMVDDELGAMWGKFKEGVRITVYADSCHSGTSTKLFQYMSDLEAAPDSFGVTASDSRLKGLDVKKLPLEAELLAEQMFRGMPERNAARTYFANKAYYDAILDAAPAGNKDNKDNKDKIQSRVVLISGCEDWQLSADGTFNGLFTAKLKVAWKKGQFNGSHPAFHEAIRKEMPQKQQPKYFPIGKENADFEKQRPWTK